MSDSRAAAPTVVSGLDEAERDRLRMSATATPAQRLAWLEEMMRLAARFAKLSPADPEARRRRTPPA